jgi:hypothetical protein
MVRVTQAAEELCKAVAAGGGVAVLQVESTPGWQGANKWVQWPDSGVVCRVEAAYLDTYAIYKRPSFAPKAKLP